MDFSFAAATLIASSGRATSISLRGDFIVAVITSCDPTGAICAIETRHLVNDLFGFLRNDEEALRRVVDESSRQLACGYGPGCKLHATEFVAADSRVFSYGTTQFRQMTG